MAKPRVNLIWISKFGGATFFLFGVDRAASVFCLTGVERPVPLRSFLSSSFLFLLLSPHWGHTLGAPPTVTGSSGFSQIQSSFFLFLEMG